MGIFDVMKKPTEQDKVMLDEVVKNYIQLIDTQEYLLKKVNGFNEMDLTPLKIELRRNLNKAKGSNLAIFDVIGKDLFQAKKECENLVVNLIDMYNKQYDKKFHVNQLPSENG